ncbi:MAG: D-2-hydroxyacid dehydrogenase [Flavobacteriales bacterium]
MKILANDGISASGKEKLENAGFQVDTEKVEQDDLPQAINDKGYAALLVRSATKVRKDLIDACPGLKFIGRGGVGVDNIDVEHAQEKGIEVVNTPGAPSQSVAELIIGHIFTISRSLQDANRQMPEKGVDDFKSLKKKYGKGQELRGKTLGIIGFGRIGQFTAQYALGCGMKVVAHDPFVDQAELEVEVPGAQTVKVNVSTISKEELLQQSDVISLHVPKQEDGSAVLGKEEIGKLKDGSILVNAARGGVIDEDALLEGLDSGKLAGVGLDVFENEPTPRKDLLDHEKISLTPHIGAATKEAQERIGVELADKIIQTLKPEAV